jgi:hypothetical protein
MSGSIGKRPVLGVVMDQMQLSWITKGVRNKNPQINVIGIND